MTTEEYISERMKVFAMNIDEFTIGQTIIDKKDNAECSITNKTMNSIEVLIKKKASKGITSKNWFDMKTFNERFKTKE